MTTPKAKKPRKRKARNPGVPVLAMNPAGEKKKKRKGRRTVAKRKTTRRRRRRHNPVPVSNPRRRHRRRRRHNPTGSWGDTFMRFGLVALGAGAAIAIGYGLRQTDLSPRTVALVQGGVSLVGGTALGHYVSEEVGAGLAITGAAEGIRGFISSTPPGGGDAPAPSKLVSGGSSARKRITMKKAMGDYDDEDLDAMGMVTASLGFLDDDDALEMGAIEAQLGEGNGDLYDMSGIGDEEEDMGAVEAELSAVDDEDMGDMDEEELFS